MPAPSTPPGLLDLLLAPWRTIQRFVRELIESDDRLRDTESVPSRVWAAVTLPARLVWGFILFMIHAWASSREGFAFLRGLPALALAGGFFAALVLADFIHNEARMVAANTGYYQYHTQKSPQHPEWAEMFARKLIEIKPEDPQQKFRLGLALERGGRLDEALDVMSSLAPAERPGYGQAHLWLASQLLQQQDQDPARPEIEAQAVAHLEAALESAEDSLEARVELAKLYQSQAERLPADDPQVGALLRLADQSLQEVLQDEDAVYYRVVSLVPAVKTRMRLAELFPGEYNLEREKQRVRDLIDQWLPQARRRFPNEIFLWQSLVACAVEIDDHEKAIDIVRSGFELEDAISAETMKQLAQLASRAQLVLARKVTSVDSRPQYRQRLYSICQAIRFNPAEKAAYVMLLDFISSPQRQGAATDDQWVTGDAVEIPLQIRWLQEEAVKPEVGVILYALVGMHKIGVGDLAGGRKSWSIGQQMDPRTQTYIFQLMDVAAGLDDGRFDNLLDMITLAIELFPEQPAFYVTRGIYLKNQKRYDEAIVDLQYVAQRSPGDVLVNQQLKFCYEKIGDDESAARQAELIEEKLAEQDLQQRSESEELLRRLEEREKQRL